MTFTFKNYILDYQGPKHKFQKNYLKELKKRMEGFFVAATGLQWNWRVLKIKKGYHTSR